MFASLTDMLCIIIIIIIIIVIAKCSEFVFY